MGFVYKIPDQERMTGRRNNDKKLKSDNFEVIYNEF